MMAKCKCNGQLTDCQVDNTTGKYSCVCGNYTTGEFCESCLPLYNNRPYAYGVACQGEFHKLLISSSFITKKKHYLHITYSKCLFTACDCNAHADSCRYDATLNAGVCIGCKNMTSG